MLPQLHNDPAIPGSLIGSLQFDAREVVLRISPDDATMEQCLSSAAQALSVLRDIDLKAKDAAATHLLPSYNEHWRHYGRSAGDGTIVDVHDTELTASDLKNRLTMTSIEALGATCYTVFYDAEKMFHGHSVVVTSFDGLLFSEVSAELFG